MATYNGADKRLAYLFENGGGGGGGTTVVANPAGEATDILNKLQVGQIIYDVAGGADGVIFDTLYQATTYPTSAGTANVTRQYTLLKSINNYDAVLVLGWLYNSDVLQTMLSSQFIPKTDFYDRPNDHGVAGTNPFVLNASFGGNKRQLVFQFDDATHITTVSLRSEAAIEPILYKVLGVKYSGYDRGHSLSEKVIGTWLDGKPLYERTFEGTIASSSSIYVLIDSGADTIIQRFDGTVGGRGLNSYYEATQYIRTWIANNKHQIAVLPSGSTFLSQPYSITLQYTKTTD